MAVQFKVTATNSSNNSISDEFNVSIADFIKVEETSLEVDASGGNITVPVKSNVDWQFIDEENDWATLTKTELGNLYIEYEPNQNVESRHIIIKLYF